MRRNCIFSSTLLALGIWCLSGLSQAQELRWTHYGLRPMAMGNAYVAVADDFNALFYNPAGLARVEEWDGEFLNPAGTISKSTVSFFSDIQELAGGAKEGETAVIDLFEKQSGKAQFMSLALTPHLIFPGFGIGIGAELFGSMVFHRYPTVDMKFKVRGVFPIAFAMNFLENRLSVGVGIKAAFEGGVDHELSIQDLEALSNKSTDENGATKEEEETVKLEDFVQGGYGFGGDVGILFTPIKTMKPTLGISIADFGGTPYEKADISGKALGSPPDRLPAVNVGASVIPYQSGALYALVAVDVHAINQPIHFSKKLNMGTEFGIGKQLLKFQLGLHQGYLTGGMQFDVGLLSLRFATYAEELGPVAGSIEDRRYALQIKLLI